MVGVDAIKGHFLMSREGSPLNFDSKQKIGHLKFCEFPSRAEMAC